MVWQRESAQEVDERMGLGGPLNLDGPGFAGEPGIWDEPEAQKCNEIIFHGSRNPDSARFGPDEECEEDAVEGEEKCAQHLGLEP